MTCKNKITFSALGYFGFNVSRFNVYQSLSMTFQYVLKAVTSGLTFLWYKQPRFCTLVTFYREVNISARTTTKVEFSFVGWLERREYHFIVILFSWLLSAVIIHIYWARLLCHCASSTKSTMLYTRLVEACSPHPFCFICQFLGRDLHLSGLAIFL